MKKDEIEIVTSTESSSIQQQPITLINFDEKNKKIEENKEIENISDKNNKDFDNIDNTCCYENTLSAVGVGDISKNPEDSGLFLYVDLHGHASKKGVFMYGNYFDDPDDTIMCMLLPKLMAINNPNFHFTSCNFAERNMYLM